MRAILPALLLCLCACQTARVEPLASEARTTAIGRTELIDPALGTLGLAFLAEGRALDDAQALSAYPKEVVAQTATRRAHAAATA